MKNNKKIIEKTLWHMMQHDYERGILFEVAYKRAEERFHKNNIQRKKFRDDDLKKGYNDFSSLVYKQEKVNKECRHCGYPTARIIYTPDSIHYAYYECDLCATHCGWMKKPT